MHTIIRLPQSTFFPATVSTNLLFFEKGTPTKDIWFYQHKLPVGRKSYSKTKPIQFNEFEKIIEWWNDRTENELAWKVNIKNIKDFDLDIQNPNKVEESFNYSSNQLAVDLNESFNKSKNLLKSIEDMLNA